MPHTDESTSTELTPNDQAQLEAIEAKIAETEEYAPLTSDEIPRVKVVQPASRDYPDEASPGDFVNVLTEQVYGPSIELVIAKVSTGRLYSGGDVKGIGEDGRVYVTADKVAPSYWPEQYAGQAFVDIPDALERYKDRANSGEIEWGSGPAIQTTTNFVGYVVEDGVVQAALPVRLSLKSTDSKAARKIDMLLRSFGPAKRHHGVIRLETKSSENSKGRWFTIQANLARRSTDEEKLAGANLTSQLAGVDVVADTDADADDQPTGSTPDAPAGAVDKF